MQYNIDINLTQVPENLMFYSNEEMTNALYKENGKINLTGYFEADNNNKTETKTLYWQWKYETGSTQEEIDANDELDSKWMDKNIILDIETTGKQITDDSQKQYIATFDLNGGCLANYDGVNQITKKVNYGQAYGELPVPVREGYTFLGWSNKNLIDTSEDCSYNIFDKKDSSKIVYDANTGIYSVFACQSKNHLVGYKVSSITTGKTYTISATIVNKSSSESIFIGFGNKNYPSYSIEKYKMYKLIANSEVR